MSLNEKILIKTIHNLWVITPHGASQKLAMLMLMHETASSPLVDTLPALSCLLSCMNWLPDLLLIISSIDHAYYYPKIGFRTNASASLPCTILMLLQPSLIISATYHAYAPELPSHVLNLTSLSS
ncbi:hypothetical protein O181_018405 [Austropuccinia psidii MF-1]|uniref:Uncharacterized protein n=1 Tax=Austropuccinia psidii MF-1 TaxID=1389203 RepID=A0A9Q3GU06_9BASI|nr:hypothetical protein [Austropuccinia psidii MF-1]